MPGRDQRSLPLLRHHERRRQVDTEGPVPRGYRLLFEGHSPARDLRGTDIRRAMDQDVETTQRPYRLADRQPARLFTREITRQGQRSRP